MKLFLAIVIFVWQCQMAFTSPTCASNVQSFPGGTCVSGWTAENTVTVPQALCPAFSSTIATGSSSVTDCKCGAGYYGTVTLAASANSCVACLLGTYSIAVGASTISTCQQCTAGSFCPTPSTKTACPAGSFCPLGVSAPTICPIGSFCPPGASAAVSCPTPSTNYETGTQSYTDCTCPAGMYGRVSSPALAVCTTCAVGQVCTGTPIKCSCAV